MDASEEAAVTAAVAAEGNVAVAGRPSAGNSCRCRARGLLRESRRRPALSWRGNLYPEEPRRLPHQFERLEWLGDAILEVTAAEELYTRFPDEAEGHLDARRKMMVSNATLIEASERLGLDRWMLRDRDRLAVAAAPVQQQQLLLQQEREQQLEREQQRAACSGAVATRRRGGGADKWKADSFEALIAAVALESGYAAAKAFLDRHLIGPLQLGEIGCGSSHGGSLRCDHDSLLALDAAATAETARSAAARQAGVQRSSWGLRQVEVRRR